MIKGIFYYLQELVCLLGVILRIAYLYRFSIIWIYDRFRGIRFELAWPVFSIIKAVNIAQTTDIRYIYLKWKDLKKPVFYLEYDTEFIWSKQDTKSVF